MAGDGDSTPQAGDGTTPQAGGTQQGAATSSTQSTAGQGTQTPQGTQAQVADRREPQAGSSQSQDPVDDELRETRREAQNLRRRLRTLEDGQDNLPQLLEERDRLRAQVALLRDPAMGTVMYPDLVLAQIPHTAIEFDEHGKPKNVVALLDGLRATYPAIFRAQEGTTSPPVVPPGGADGGAGGGRPAPALSMNDMLRKAAGRG